jgi:agmatinase
MLQGAVALLGVPYDDSSSFLRGAAHGPAAIRAALRSPAGNLCCEDGRDLAAEPRFADAGDVLLAAGDDAIARIETEAAEVIGQGARLLALGGDHAVTWPIVRALARRHRGLTILHLDAHPDLYDEFEGSRRSHACPFARIMEEGLAARLVQVGVRAATPHQRAQAQRFGVETIDMRAFRRDLDLDLQAPLYVSIDLDALDPACAPGVSHREPGGLSVRDVLGIVQRLPHAPLAADVVELNPVRDVAGMTALVAAKLVKELAARMLADHPRGG